MALKPDGKSARTERVTFTRPAAERIAQVVRHVEQGDRNSPGLTFRSPIGGTGDGRITFRIATFTGAWSVNASKTVTLKYQTNTPNTVVATNLFFPFPAPSSDRDCSIARDGTAWYLVDVPFEAVTAVVVTGVATQTMVSSVVTSGSTITYLSGISVNASFNTSNCSITVNTTQTSASTTVVTGVTLATASIDVVTGTQTTTILSFKA